LEPNENYMSQNRKCCDEVLQETLRSELTVTSGKKNPQNVRPNEIGNFILQEIHHSK
jgi:hypothetical protein